MAPPHQLGKRVKLTQVRRPFIVGTTAIPFSETNPRPPGAPDSHTHSWQVFVKGLEDTDITYWCRRVQFKLHESIANHMRTIDGEPGKPFIVNETGWGEFEIAVKLYYAAESGEKPQTMYHYLRLHPYGRTEEEKQAMVMDNGEVRSWSYEEQLFNEPYDVFHRILTSGAVPRGWPTTSSSTSSPATANVGKGKARAAAAAAAAAAAVPPPPALPAPDSGEVWERTAMIPRTSGPGQPFSREAEAAEVAMLKGAKAKVEEMTKSVLEEIKSKEERLRKLKEENVAAAKA